LAKKKTTAKATTEQERIKMLQQQLADEKLKVAALNTLIDVAEEQLKINIRKKPGARQS
jgi:transposase